jgi:hypothetical protein
MTVTELRDALLALRWSANDLADEAGVKDTVVRRWISGKDPIPKFVADGLIQLASFHEANPLIKKDPEP